MVKKVGVLALYVNNFRYIFETNLFLIGRQGAFIEHVNKLKGLGIDAIEVRTPQQLKVSKF